MSVKKLAPKKSVGRPTKLTKETTESLMKSLSLGMTYKHSCLIAGIVYETFRDWMNKGDKDENKDSEYSCFSVEVKKAVAKGIQENVQSIKQDDTWQSKAWLLERQHPTQYGKFDRLGVSNEDKTVIIERAKK